MRIYRGTSYLPVFPHPVVTMGVFDGVHRGHLAVLRKTVSEARAREGTSIVITYDPHPKAVLTPGNTPKMLQSIQERLESIEKAGIDECIVFDFTKTFSEIPAHEFIQEIVQNVHPVHFVIGYNHTFGYMGKGDSGLLSTLGKKYGFTVEVVEAVLEGGKPVSSTNLRNRH